jgi:hypothetical protein
MFYFNEVSCEQLISDLGGVALYEAENIKGALKDRHRIVYRDSKPYCIFHSKNSGYTHLENFLDSCYFPGSDYKELGPFLEKDDMFRDFLNNEWIKKEFEELRERMYSYFELYKSGTDCYIEVTNDPFWWEGYMMWKILEKEKNEIRRSLKYKGKLPKVELGYGPSLEVTYRR